MSKHLKAVADALATIGRMKVTQRTTNRMALACCSAVESLTVILEEAGKMSDQIEVPLTSAESPPPHSATDGR